MSKGFASSYRIVVLASLVLLSFAGLGCRLVWLHVLDRQELLDTVEKARRQIIVEYARRGDILDSRGNILATSRSLIDLGADPQLVRPEDEKKWPQLAALIGMPLPDLERILTTKFRPAGAPPPLRKAAGGFLTYDFSYGPKKAEAPKTEEPAASAETSDDDIDIGEADANGERPIQWVSLSDEISESTFAEITKLGVRGIYGNRVYRRVYPHNELAAHVIGYVNRQQQAVTGMESYVDFYLHGQNGWVESEKDGRRVELAQFRTREVPAADGYSVELSLDAVVQHIAETELAAIMAKFQPHKATIIVSDPRTGFILALANSPTFNLNDYNKIPASEQNRMRNAAVADMYEPGSVFKIVAAAGALNDALVSPATMFDCSLEKVMVNGTLRGLPGENVGDHFERLSVADIIARSSNKGAAQLGVLLGAQRFYSYVRDFGFGHVTGFPVGGEIPGLVRPPEKWDGLTITRMPMGQSVGVTALQIHQAMGVIASGGLLLQPRIIRQIRDASGNVVYRLGPAQVRRVISEKTARTMAQMLERVVTADDGRPASSKDETGTGGLALIPGYDVAGKTGTANKVINGQYSKHDHVVSFVGFFPARNPQVAISVIIDDPDAHTVGGLPTGGYVAAPSFKNIGEQLIPYLDIKPDIGEISRPLLAMEGGRR